jgi:hypothetical protein
MDVTAVTGRSLVVVTKYPTGSIGCSQFGSAWPPRRPEFRALGVTQFIVATPKSSPLDAPSRASPLTTGPARPAFGDRDGCNRYQQFGRVAFWAISTPRIQCHSLAPLNSITYTPPLTVAYPAIKIIDQSRASSGEWWMPTSMRPNSS